MTPKLLENKVALVTGAGQGIGLEICKTLAANGAIVVLNDVEKVLAEEAAHAVHQQFGTCVPMPGDASHIGFIEQMVNETKSRFGRLDIVIANAGITLFGEFLTYTEKDFMQVMQVNLAGSFFLAQAAARHMKTYGKGGSILFMSSVTAHQAHKNLAAYGMSKAALEMLAKTLVLELSPYSITINALAPGATLTERTARDATYEKTWSNITPLGRPASTKDIADAAMFLVSPQARHITGQTIVIDGGWTSISPSPY